jgi:nucleolar pre-ribosomal-associated protein 1
MSPSISNVIPAIFPTTLTKLHITKGLQSPSRLVRHLTGSALARILQKLREAVNSFTRISSILGEEADGRWSALKQDVVKEVVKRLPDFQVIIALVQGDHGVRLTGTATETFDASNYHAMAQEVALRIMWLYGQCLPDITEESRFDVGKLLLSVTGDEQASLVAGSNLKGLSQLHVLRLLEINSHFSWSTKLGTHKLPSPECCYTDH